METCNGNLEQWVDGEWEEVQSMLQLFEYLIAKLVLHSFFILVSRVMLFHCYFILPIYLQTLIFQVNFYLAY
jgi:hypothetical protein